MPRYAITATYSSPAELTPEQHQALGTTLEGAVVAQLRVSTGEGRVPATVRDALALIRAWHAAERMGLPLVVAAGMPRDAVALVDDEGQVQGVITNVGD